MHYQKPLTCRIINCLYYIAIFILIIPNAKAFSDENKIITTIRPVYLITKELTKEVAKPRLLLDKPVSAHHYALSLRDRRLLSEADIIIYADKNIESFLQKSLNTINAKQFIFSTAKGVYNLSSSGDIGHNHDHAHGEIDGHVWLSPKNTIAIANELTKELYIIYPEQKAKIAKNLEMFVAEIQAHYTKWQSMFSKSQKAPSYVVLHDAYRYFEHDYKLMPSLVIGDNSHMPFSAKAIKELHLTLSDELISCVITEPNHNLPELDDKYRIITLDPLGWYDKHGNLSPVARYIDILDNIADNLFNCKNRDGNGIIAR